MSQGLDMAHRPSSHPCKQPTTRSVPGVSRPWRVAIMLRSRISGAWVPAVAAILLATGAASALGAKPPTIFQPTESGNVRSFFRNGSALAAIQSDSVFALAEIEPCLIGSVSYARLWILVENRSARPLLLEP